MKGINIEQLCFDYNASDGKSTYNKFHARINKAGVYGVFGCNGSGKSTLLKLLSGLLTPKSGTIEVMGYEPRQRLPAFLSQIYILPEEFHLPDLTPQQLGNSHHHFYPNFSLILFQEYLQKLDVPSNKRFSQMSLGQKKKSAIAFALATLTPVLLMDEPTNGLDIVSREQFKDLMATEEQKQRIVLISTHQAHDLESIISQILFIDEGTLLLSSSMAQIEQSLIMGVAQTSDDLPTNVLYQENMAGQIAWLASNQDLHKDKNLANAPNIEMLYKALNFSKKTVIDAINDHQREV